MALRVAKMAGELNVLHDHHAAWPSRLDHCLQRLLGLSQVGQYEPPENKVEDGIFVNLSGTANPKTDGQFTAPGLLAGQFQAAFIEINADNLTVWPDPFAHVKRDGPDPAAHVQAAHVPMQIRSFEKRFRCGPFDRRQVAQPLGSFIAATQNIIGFFAFSSG
jgi:hypothetical protein